jgi:hypothetical protein
LSIKGVILRLTYQLRRHLWAEWPLSRWLGLLFLVAIVGSLFVAWLRPWAAVLLGLLYLIYLLFLSWASRREYVHYESLDSVDALGPDVANEPALRPEELVPVRASGWFSVEGRDRFYMDLEADFETVATREHILLGRVHPSQFLLLGRWPVDELGWWYVFFRPSMVTGMDLGHLFFGPEAQQVLRITYAEDAKTEQTLYLAFDTDAALRRVWADIIEDAPPKASLPTWLHR